jgi:hypothetical protein
MVKHEPSAKQTPRRWCAECCWYTLPRSDCRCVYPDVAHRIESDGELAEANTCDHFLDVDPPEVHEVEHTSDEAWAAQAEPMP